ncbi:MAG: hypothetical protein H6937_07095 [Burkholderiales bacterium]|nr:hypothetical protein [Burkholderiales bacterium]
MKISDVCADCGGYDIEWMYTCRKHNLQYCRGCDCPYCADEEMEEHEDEYSRDAEFMVDD